MQFHADKQTRRDRLNSLLHRSIFEEFDVLIDNKYRLFNVLCWLWNIYEGAPLPSVYFITNTKHCITYLALTQLFPPEMYTLCSILLHSVYGSHFIFSRGCVHMGQMEYINSIFC